MKGSLKKGLTTVLLYFILLSMFTGCGVKAGSSSESTQTVTVQSSVERTETKTEVPYEFSIFRSSWTNLNEDTDIVIQELNRKLNIKINILTCPYEAWVEKYNIYVTSGQVPDLSVTTGQGTMNFNTWAQQGVYLDLTDLYNEYCPNIQKYVSNDIIEAHKINGKLYGIPRPSLSDSTYAIRADWLEKLNLRIPETLDDLYAVLKAFKENDPDGNDKDDTYGLVSENTLSTAGIIFGAFNCSVSPISSSNTINWISDGNGGLQSCLMASGMKDAIIYMAKLYRDKILDQEWMLTKSQVYNDKVHTGKVGFTATSFSSMITDTESKIRSNDPACELAILDGVTGPEGKYAHPMQKGFYMASSISSKAKNPQKILEFLDYLMSSDGDKLIRYGIEGLTYTKGTDGKIVLKQDAIKQYGMESGHSFRQILQPPVIVILGDDPRNPEILNMSKALYNGPFYPAPTIQPPSLKDVATKQGSDFVMNSVTAIVTGKDDVGQQWDAFIKQWKETGGDQLTKEVNEIYTANRK